MQWQELCRSSVNYGSSFLWENLWPMFKGTTVQMENQIWANFSLNVEPKRATSRQYWNHLWCWQKYHNIDRVMFNSCGCAIRQLLNDICYLFPFSWFLFACYSQTYIYIVWLLEWWSFFVAHVIFSWFLYLFHIYEHYRSIQRLII